MMNVELYHVDTCLSCYLQDHHNRPGELLLGVPVDGATTYEQVMEGLYYEFGAYAAEEYPSYKDFGEAIRECFSAVTDMAAVFDDTLEINVTDADWDEPCYAWFVLKWEVKDDD